MAKDMTVGNPIKVITAFAIPMFIGSIFQQVYNMVDSVVVGRFVGAQALGAVGSCASTFSLMISLITGLTGGMGIVLAQYFGAKNEKMVRISFVSSFMVILLVGVLVTVFGSFLVRPVLHVMNTPSDIFEDAATYLGVLVLGTIASCLYNGMSGALRALGDSVAPLIILIISSLMNVVLDLAFVLGLNMGVMGVGLATVLSQLISALLALVYTLGKMPLLRFGRADLRPDWEVILEIIRIGVPAALSSFGVSLSAMFLQAAVNSFGSTVVAAYTIGNRGEHIGLGLSYSIGIAVGTFCGQNMGARRFDRVRAGMRAGHLIAIAYTVVVGVALFIFARPIAMLFTDDTSVIPISITCIRIIAVFAPFLGLVFIYQNFLRSTGDIAPTVWMSLCEIFARSVLAFVFAALWGYNGIWWVTPVGWGASLLVGILRYRSGKWKTKLIVKEQPDGA